VLTSYFFESINAYAKMASHFADMNDGGDQPELSNEQAIEQLQLPFATLLYFLRPSRPTNVELSAVLTNGSNSTGGDIKLSSSELLTLLLIEIVADANAGVCPRPMVTKLYTWKIPDATQALAQTTYGKLERARLIKQTKDSRLESPNKNQYLITITEIGRKVLNQLKTERAQSIKNLLLLLSACGVTLDQLNNALKPLCDQMTKEMFDQSFAAKKRRNQSDRIRKRREKRARNGTSGAKKSRSKFGECTT